MSFLPYGIRRNMKINIVIAGYGPVGIAVEAALSNHPHVSITVDDPRVGKHAQDEDVEAADGVVVCVATPESETGMCETKNVLDVFDKYGDTRYLIKSAIDPLWIKTCAPDKTTVSPEFLRGTTGADPTQDFLDQTFAIYGGGEQRWWHEIFKPVLPKLNTIRFVSLEQAAFAKYLENTFLATKVTFFNEMYNLYNQMEFEGFDIMVEAICNDPRIGLSHTQVPGPDGKFGYGGHCFPKDVAALRHAALRCKGETPILDAITESNKKYRNKDV